MSKVIGILISTSILAITFLFWIIYFNPFQIQASPLSSTLPLINALLNTLAAICLVYGLRSIRSNDRNTHKRWMISAFICSSLFLITYIIYHTIHGDTRFLTEGFIRYLYFFILISHVLLSIIALPIILITFYLALSDRIQLHKRIAKLTWSLWMYVSVTGVLVYVFVRFLNSGVVVH